MPQVFNRDRSVLWFAFLRRDLPPPSKWRMRMMITCLCLIMILLGWAAGAVGPLLPYLQGYYHITYLTISTVFITSFAGNLIAGVANVYLTDRLGFGLCAILGPLSQGLGYALMCWGGPFPLFAVAYAMNGFGFGIANAQVNALTSRMKSANHVVFVVQACFGVGALISPLISTGFVQTVKNAYLYFAVALGLSVFTAILIAVAFEFRTDEQILSEGDSAGGLVSDSVIPLNTIGDNKSKASTHPSTPTPLPEESESTPEPPQTVKEDLPPAQAAIAPQDGQALENSTIPARKDISSGAKLKRILVRPITWVLLVWNLFYVGVEVAIGSWATSYLISDKGGNESAGYVTTGYYASLTIGRIILMPFIPKIGYTLSIQTLSILSLGFQLVAWLVPSLVGSAVAMCIIALFLGPIFPAELMIISDLYEEELQTGVMGFLGAMGGAGAAIVPFATGALSNRYGIRSMQPFCVSLFAALIILWSFVPSKHNIWGSIFHGLKKSS